MSVSKHGKEYVMCGKTKKSDNRGRVELHCHLDGSLPLETVRALTGRADLTLEDLQARPDCGSLKEYLEKFDLPLEGMQTREGLVRAAADFLYSLKEDAIRYVEVRFAPMQSVHPQLSCRQVLESVLEGLERAGKETGIDGRVIVCAMRHHSEETNLKMMRTAREFLGQGVCALDLAGDEASHPVKEFRRLFAEAKKLQFPFTIHAGECGNVENVREAVALGASRIGHGIALRRDPGFMETVGRLGIGLELCPTSNFQTRAARPEDYPLETFLRARLAVSINTDNRTVSQTTLSRELELASRLSRGLGDERLFTENAVRTAFLDDEEKEELLGKLEIS